MAVRIEHVGDVAIVIAEGTFITHEQIDALDDALTQLIVENEQKKCLLNVGAVRHMSSLGIGVIVRAHSQAKQRGAALYLCGFKRAKRPELTILLTNILAALNHFEDCEEALKALQEV
jgi:anti-anti-sigma factor